MDGFQGDLHGFSEFPLLALTGKWNGLRLSQVETRRDDRLP